LGRLAVTLVPLDKGDVTVIIPTLNEKKAIGRGIRELKEIGYHSILVVDGLFD